jgi:hypothetical protein
MSRRMVPGEAAVSVRSLTHGGRAEPLSVTLTCLRPWTCSSSFSEKPHDRAIPCVAVETSPLHSLTPENGPPRGRPASMSVIA